MKRTVSFLQTNAQRYALIGACFGLLFPIVAILICTVGAGIPLNISNIVAAHVSDPLLWIIDTAPLFLGLFAAIAGRRQDELEKINSMLKTREQELQAAQRVMEERVSEHTRELAATSQLFMERAELLNSVVDTAQVLLSTLGFDQLLPLIVQMISRHFKFYHVGLYLLDEHKQRTVLMAYSGKDEPPTVQQGQQVGLSEHKLVELAVRTGQAQRSNDGRSDIRWIPDPALPNARAELVLPLTSAQIIIGALDFHADFEMEFSEEYVSILQILADLVTIALQNSFLYDKTQRTLREAEVSSRQISAREWRTWVESIQARGYRYDGIRAEPIKGTDDSSPEERRIQSIPIRLRGRTIGTLRVRLSEGAPEWTEDDHAIAEATAERAALALEGARLLEEAKKRATREAFLSEMAAKLGASFRLDSILRDTVQQLGETLENSTVSFQLIDPTAPRDMAPFNETSAQSKDME
jgi:GAF domain-containing protein